MKRYAWLFMYLGTVAQANPPFFLQSGIDFIEREFVQNRSEGALSDALETLHYRVSQAFLLLRHESSFQLSLPEDLSSELALAQAQADLERVASRAILSGKLRVFDLILLRESGRPIHYGRAPWEGAIPEEIEASFKYLPAKHWALAARMLRAITERELKRHYPQAEKASPMLELTFVPAFYCLLAMDLTAFERFHSQCRNELGFLGR